MERSTDNSYIDILTNGESKMKTCNTCTFYDKKGRDHGLCRRYPPTQHLPPTVDGNNDYCGEHSEIPAEVPQVVTTVEEVTEEIEIHIQS